MTSKQTLKNWFSNLKKPTQHHFWAWLDSYFHKEEKIPMQNIEGLENALQDTASSTQINNHFLDNQAHKDLFDLKVDKEEGKQLSSENFTSELKEKLENMQNIDPSNYLQKGTFSGTAQDLKTAIDDILAILRNQNTQNTGNQFN